MTRPAWQAALALAAITLAAGCGSQHGPAGATARPPAPPSLALSVSSPVATWATVEMGGSAADYNNFWQLFVRPAASTTWRLVTPPGMASNGGLVLASPGGRSLLAAFRPSQDISFSPMTATSDDGAHWATGQLAAGLADVPDALAASPAGGGLAALAPGAVELSRPGGSGWARLATLRSLAATAAGRACRLTGFTAAAFSPAGAPLVAGSCAQAGVTGIFTYTGGAWQATGPALPASLAGQPVTVLRLSTAAGRETALLAAGSGAKATVLAAWAGSGAGRWVLSPVLRAHGGHVVSASLGPGGSVALVLPGGRGETLSGPGGSWRKLPALPAGTQVLAPGASGAIEALAAHRSVMTVWSHTTASAGWARQQVTKVPILYGSSS
jgi:hypothetical protein